MAKSPSDYSLIDTTNVTAATHYYPAIGYQDMGNHSGVSFTWKLIDADWTLTLTVEATNDIATGDWIDVTKQMYLDDGTTTNASVTVTNGTVTYALVKDTFNYKFYRVKVIASWATNTVIVKWRHN